MSRLGIMLAVALVCIFLAGPSSVAQQRRDGSGLPEGQFVSIIKKSNPHISTDLEKIELCKIEGKSFLVGKGADVPDNWQKGKMVWVAMDDVSEFTVFATIEELRKAGVQQEIPKKDGGPK
jgi:hypothetical protein